MKGRGQKLATRKKNSCTEKENIMQELVPSCTIKHKQIYKARSQKPSCDTQSSNMKVVQSKQRLSLSPPLQQNLCQTIDIVKYLTSTDITQGCQSPSGQLKDAGSQITPQMRVILLKWLLNVSSKFGVQQDTTHLCIQLVDSLLLKQPKAFNKCNFQLLGICSLFVACKYNQIYTLDANKYLASCDGLYTLRQLLQMECFILNSIGFQIRFITVQQFTSFLMNHIPSPSCQLQAKVKMLTTLSLFDFDLSNTFPKSHISIAILRIALDLTGFSIVNPTELAKSLQSQTYDCQPCFNRLMHVYQATLKNRTNTIKQSQSIATNERRRR